jgi:hypothetical protein
MDDCLLRHTPKIAERSASRLMSLTSINLYLQHDSIYFRRIAQRVPPYLVGSMHVAIGFTNSDGFPHV